MVLGRCAPKTGLTRVAWACTLLETEILGIYNPADLLSLFSLRWDLVDFSTIICEADKYLSLFFLSHPCWDNSPQSSPVSLAFWNPCWAQLHGDLRMGLVRAAWNACPSIPLRKPLSCYIICWWFFTQKMWPKVPGTATAICCTGWHFRRAQE